MKPFVRSVRAVMVRRILVNFRIEPETLQRSVPAPFRVKVVRGWGLAGICLIRLKHLRPGPLPALLGLNSENAAHRIAVTWDTDTGEREGVFIPRRDTDSRINRWAGGRLFPGVHGAATFGTREEPGRFEITMRSHDGEAAVRVVTEPSDRWPSESVFETLTEASDFFRRGGCGWSPAPDGRGFEGTELEPDRWEMTPLGVRTAESDFFSDPRRFPTGTVELDSAIEMRGIAHTWRNLGRFDVGAGAGSVAVRRPRGTHGASALFRFP